MKKLIYVINQYSQHDSSHFYHIGNLIEGIAEQGVAVAAVVLKGNTAPEFKNPNINTYVVKSTGLMAYVELFGLIRQLTALGYDRIFVRIAAMPLIVSRLASLFHQAKTYLWQSGTVYEFDMEQPLSKKKLIWYVKSFLPNWLARKITSYFVTGPEYMGEYYAKVVGVNPQKIKILYNDIDLLRFTPSQYQHHKADQVVQLLMVHRLSPVRKTLYYLPYVIEKLRDKYPHLKFHLMIVGGGSEKVELEAEIKRLDLGSYITLTGAIANKDITTLYQQADIFIQPSYNEGFPRVVLEAMASGLPIVATDAGGIHQIVGSLQKEQVVPRDDRDGFVVALARLIENPELRQQLVHENLNTVKRFSTAVIADMYIKEIFHG